MGVYGIPRYPWCDVKGVIIEMTILLLYYTSFVTSYTLHGQCFFSIVHGGCYLADDNFIMVGWMNAHAFWQEIASIIHFKQTEMTAFHYLLNVDTHSTCKDYHWIVQIFFHCTLKLNNELLVMQDEFPCHIVIIIREQNHTSRGIKYNLCNQYTPGKP